jgi:hypothetical protein
MNRILLTISLVALIGADWQNKGISYIGICQRNVSFQDVKDIYRKADTINLHFLARSFNPQGCPSFVELAKDSRPMVLHVSLINGPGLRNRRLSKHEWLYGYTVKTAEEAIRRNDSRVLRHLSRAASTVLPLLRLRKSLPTVVRIKPILESDFSLPIRRRVHKLVARRLKGLELIDNPVRGRCLENVLCETHGANIKGDIVDLDGLSAYDIDLQQWTKDTQEKVGRFIWIHCNNGLGKELPWRPPLTRTLWCTGDDVKTLNSWLIKAETPD